MVRRTRCDLNTLAARRAEAGLALDETWLTHIVAWRCHLVEG